MVIILYCKQFNKVYFNPSGQGEIPDRRYSPRAIIIAYYSRSGVIPEPTVKSGWENRIIYEFLFLLMQVFMSLYSYLCILVSNIFSCPGNYL